MKNLKDLPIKKGLTLLLLVITLFWISTIIKKSENEILFLFKSFTIKKSFFLLLSLSVASIGLFQYVIIFREILTKQTIKKYSIKYLSALYFNSQIVRYLPGRFFGIFYQALKTNKKIPTNIIIQSNLELMAFVLIFHFLSAVCIYFFIRINYISGLLSIIFILILIFFYLKSNVFNKIINKILTIVPKKIRIHFSKSNSDNYSNKSIITIMSSYAISWVFYLFAWGILSKIFPSLSVKSSVLLCSFYTISWIIGFISMLTPGGLGIRESVFIYVSSIFKITNNIAFFSVFLRVWLILIDLLLALFSAVLNFNSKEEV